MFIRFDWPMIKSTLFEEQSTFSFLISASIGGISGNCILPIFHACTPKHLRLVTFGLYLRTRCLGNELLFGCISASIGKTFLKTDTSHSPRKRCILSKFVGNGSIIKGTLLGECSISRLYLEKHWRDFSETSYPAFFLHVLQMK